jgi:hypothetical protein
MQMARNMLSTEQMSAATSHAGTAQKAIFRKEGEYWTVGCGEGALVRFIPVNSERRRDRLHLESRELRRRSEQLSST